MPNRRRDGARTMLGRSRSLADLRRTAGRKQPGRTILVVCEGAKTEKHYFGALCRSYRLSTIEVEIVGEGEAPISVVDRALDLRRDRERSVRGNRGRDVAAPPVYDEVWCVFDTEFPPHNPSFHQAVNKAIANGLNLAISNPAFEFWLLLHFRFTTMVFNDNDELIRALRDHLRTYEKGQDCFPQLAAGVDAAITNARRIHNRREEGEAYPHPSTAVFLLVEALQGMRRSWQNS